MEDTTSPSSTVEERRFSAASSPRKGNGLQPLWSPPPNPGSRDFSPTAAHGRNRMELPKERLRNRHEPTHHRGRAALQRRVQPYYKENGLQPLRSSLARHRKLARNGTTSVVPKPANKIDRSSPHGYAAIITDATHHRGRAALQRRVKPSKKNGLQPLWMARRKDCCLPKPPRTGGAPRLASFARHGVPRTHPLRV